jgi:CubicO group peptidase (beta-lactamase class C family)
MNYRTIKEKGFETWLDSEAPSLLKKHKVPGVAVAVVRDDKVRYLKCWGVECADNNASITMKTLFEAASLTKPVFAYGVYGLIRDRVLELDRPLSEYLQEPVIKGDDERLRKITARMVLSHTSGIPNKITRRWVMTDSERGASNAPEPLKLEFEPGSSVRYSGEGYNYLQHVVEIITGQRLDLFMKSAVLGPLDMNGSTFVWDDNKDQSVAIPHDESGRAVNEWQWRSLEPMVAGTLITTIVDYAKFLSAMLSNRKFNHSKQNQKLWTAEIDKMLQPQFKLKEGFSWSLGWGLEEQQSETFFWQWGDKPGFQHFTAGSRSRKEAVVVLTNGQNGLKVCRQIVEAVFKFKMRAFDNI